MDCVDIADRLLVDKIERDPELDAHVAGCARCAKLARGLRRLDVVLSSALVVTPPLALQYRLAELASSAARPRTAPWWQRLPEAVQWLTQRPQMVAAQGLATLMIALASWQVFGWVSATQPVVGDVAYAFELVAASPAAAYLGGFQIDLQSLGLWSAVGAIGWLVSENGLIGRRLASRGVQLP